MLLNCQPDDHVLDACAAPGGKTCHILETQPNIQKIIALDIDIVLVYLFQPNSSECNVLAKNIDESLYSFLSLKDILPKKLNIKKMFSDKYELVSQVRHRKINLVSILDISNGNRDVL